MRTCICPQFGLLLVVKLMSVCCIFNLLQLIWCCIISFHDVFVQDIIMSQSFLYFNVILLCDSIYSLPLLVYSYFVFALFIRLVHLNHLWPTRFPLLVLISLFVLEGQFPCSSLLFPCTDAVHLYSSELCGGLPID